MVLSEIHPLCSHLVSNDSAPCESLANATYSITKGLRHQSRSTVRMADEYTHSVPLPISDVSNDAFDGSFLADIPDFGRSNIASST